MDTSASVSAMSLGVPDEYLAPLEDATSQLSDAAALRRSFDEEGYLLLRGALDRTQVLAARAEVLGRLSEVGEICSPAIEGIATGESRRGELAGDLGAFWKTVSEGPALRRVTHGAALRELLSLLFDAPARPHDYVFVRPTAVGSGTDLHFDQPYFARGDTRIATCWIPLGEIPISDGPLVIVEGSHRAACLRRSLPFGNGSSGLAAAQDAAYQLAARGARLLTTHFHPGDLLIFDSLTMHGALDNKSGAERVRLSVDLRFQPAADPADDQRYFGPNPTGAAGGGYADQKDAQPLGTAGGMPH